MDDSEEESTSTSSNKMTGRKEVVVLLERDDHAEQEEEGGWGLSSYLPSCSSTNSKKSSSTHHYCVDGAGVVKTRKTCLRLLSLPMMIATLALLLVVLSSVVLYPAAPPYYSSSLPGGRDQQQEQKHEQLQGEGGTMGLQNHDLDDGARPHHDHDDQLPSFLLYSSGSSTTVDPPTRMVGERDVLHDEEGENNERGGSRQLFQQRDEDCVLSGETPFDVEILVELNSTSNCAGPAASDGTFVFLSENDKGRLEDTLVASFTKFEERYCDPYFRNVSSAKIVRQGISPLHGSSLTLEVQVWGTLRCQQQQQQQQQQGCNADEIGLFDFPQEQALDLQEPPTSCGACPNSNDTSIIARNRGPTEVEFMEYLGRRLATVAPFLDCPDLQVADCAFGTVFKSAFAVTFRDQEAAISKRNEIGPGALETLNALYTGDDDPNACYPDRRVFTTSRVAFPGDPSSRRGLFVDGGRALLNGSIPSAAPSESTTSLFFGSTTTRPHALTARPSEYPTALFFDSTTTIPPQQPLTAIVYVDGICSQCGSDIFLSNDVSARRRGLDAEFQDAMMGDRPARTVQAIKNATKSNCFCPIDSVVVVGEARSVPAIEQFRKALEIRLQLEIAEIQQLDPDDIVVDDGSFVSNGTYRFPCTNLSSFFKKNVTLELQVTCSAVPELSDDDKNRIGTAYVSSYNSLRSTLCDPFRLEVTAAKVVATGDARGGGTSLPLMIEVTVVCSGCNPLATNVYGFPGLPDFSTTKNETTGINETRRYLSASNGLMTTRRDLEDGMWCTCDSTLPRRAPLEADVTEALDLTLSQQEDLVVACLGNTTACDFGIAFRSSVLIEVQGNDTATLASILVEAFPNALNRLIGGGNATVCNPLFGLVTNTEVFSDIVYNSVEKNVNETARRQLQNLPTVAPTSDLTFMFSWSASGANTSEAPTTAPTVQLVDDTAFFLLDAFGLCNGCPAEIIFNDNVNARRRIDQITADESDSTSMSEFRFLQEITGLEPESECFCQIGSVPVVADLEQISFLEIIQEEVAKISNTTTVIGAVSGITRVDCVDETPFSTTINFAFSAFEWVVNNPADVQGLGDAIASIYNGLVEEFCDEYFRNSVSLTYVTGSLQRVSAQRHDRDLQNTQGCFNYRATFSVAGLCRGCQALGTPIPLFGDSSTTSRKLDEVKRQPSPLSRQQRRLQEAGSTCICDSTSISQRSAPSREAIRAGLPALITSLPWAQNPSICGLPVQVEIPCPILPTGPSTTMTVRFYARRFNNGCLTAADLLQIAADFTTAFNSREQLERFPCEPQYLQVSNVVIDPSTLAGCRRELLRGGTNDDGGESQSHDGLSRQLRQDFSLMPVSMTITGNIWATNLAAILAGEGSNLMAAADDITAISGGIYEVYTGRATNSPSAMPSGFPSDFPSAFPSEFPSEEPSKSPSADPSRKPSRSPSTNPTINRPTIKPSTDPTSKPSIGPSRRPSKSPSVDPSSKPSRSPSRKPSADPTRKPSRSPSRRPSKSPSADPTTDPSSKPSRSPSVDPSGKPSSSPRPSKSPSADPSSKPSRSPSASPSTSKPSSFPSTNFPSESPSTSQPSSVPSTELCNTLSDSCTGDLIKVQDWCNSLADPPCCVNGACAWSGEATISKGACVGQDACVFASPASTSITVGANACNGKLACNLITGTAGTSIFIGANSCRGGDYACNYIGQTYGTSVSIGANSCVGSGVCTAIGYYGGSDGITIGTAACRSNWACSNIAQHASLVQIGDFACTNSFDIDFGLSVCENMGSDLTTSVVIDPSACTESCGGCGDQYACDGVGATTCLSCSCFW